MRSPYTTSYNTHTGFTTGVVRERTYALARIEPDTRSLAAAALLGTCGSASSATLDASFAKQLKKSA